MPEQKKWQGAGSMHPTSDPKQDPAKGPSSAGTQKRWQGAYSEHPTAKPTDKPPGAKKG